MSLCFIHVVEYIVSFFLFITAESSFAWICHLLLTHSQTNGYLDGFHFGAIMNNTARNITYKFLCGHMFSFILGRYLRISMLKTERIHWKDVHWLPATDKHCIWVPGIQGWIKCSTGPSLMVQCFRIVLPVQGTQVWFLVLEDITWLRTTKPLYHNDWVHALELTGCNRRSHCSEKPEHPNEE